MQQIYSPLLTDLYQFTMSYGYWKLQMHEQDATFHLLFRKNPFAGNYALSCGLASAVEYLQHWRFQQDDLAYLATLTNPHGDALFSADFLAYLESLRFSCDIDAIPEGTVVFPNTPLLRITGPLIQCQLLETPLLNLLNFQTLIATKASRVCRAAEGEPVIEFGMRRAQGPDGAISASRAAYIGGCVATSNTLAGKLFNIPVKGTHAHSWITAFPSEQDAFAAYAEVLPFNGIYLVDTYNTLTGVTNAIAIGQKLRKEGAELLGIRLDSGDLADLSIKARKLLDDAGFEQTQILASNSLDEYVINSLKQQNAKISLWGVGTHLATAYDQPTLDGVYKLSALRNKAGEWEYKIKLSEQPVKTSNPGRHQVRRFFSNNQALVDVIYDLDLGIAEIPETAMLDAATSPIRLDDYDACADLLEPIFRQGKLIAPVKTTQQIREQAIAEVTHFYKQQGDKPYPVALEKNLFLLKQELMKKFSGQHS